MPIYEYRCNDCENNTELVQKFSDPPATKCPYCHNNSLEKIISAASFHLKGSGWYVTDFRDKKEDSKTKSLDNKQTDTKETKSNDGTKTTSTGQSD